MPVVDGPISGKIEDSETLRYKVREDLAVIKQRLDSHEVLCTARMVDNESAHSRLGTALESLSKKSWAILLLIVAGFVSAMLSSKL
jgi:hypothetical protein